jgi:hypothetical protein
MTLTNIQLTSTVPWQGPSGTAGAPSVTFSGDSNTGLYNVGADTLGVATGGTNRLTLSTSSFTSTVPTLAPSGSAAAPSYSFSGDTNAGIYSVGADQIGIATNGALRMTVDSSGNLGIGKTPASRLDVNGSYQGVMTSITSNTTLGEHQFVAADATSGAFTVTLPSCTSTYFGRLYNVKKIDSSANAVTIDAAGSEVIDGALTYIIQIQYRSVALVCGATGAWYIY